MLARISQLYIVADAPNGPLEWDLSFGVFAHGLSVNVVRSPQDVPKGSNVIYLLSDPAGVNPANIRLILEEGVWQGYGLPPPIDLSLYRLEVASVPPVHAHIANWDKIVTLPYLYYSLASPSDVRAALASYWSVEMPPYSVGLSHKEYVQICHNGVGFLYTHFGIFSGMGSFQDILTRYTWIKRVPVGKSALTHDHMSENDKYRAFLGHSPIDSVNAECAAVGGGIGQFDDIFLFALSFFCPIIDAKFNKLPARSRTCEHLGELSAKCVAWLFTGDRGDFYAFVESCKAKMMRFPDSQHDKESRDAMVHVGSYDLCSKIKFDSGHHSSAWIPVDWGTCPQANQQVRVLATGVNAATMSSMSNMNKLNISGHDYYGSTASSFRAIAPPRSVASTVLGAPPASTPILSAKKGRSVKPQQRSKIDANVFQRVDGVILL